MIYCTPQLEGSWTWSIYVTIVWYVPPLPPDLNYKSFQNRNSPAGFFFLRRRFLPAAGVEDPGSVKLIPRNNACLDARDPSSVNGNGIDENRYILIFFFKIFSL